MSLAGASWARGSCGTGGELGSRLSVTFEGSVYYVTTPANYSPMVPWPLIVGLHGDEGDPARSVNNLWRDVTNGSFIFVAPKAPNEGGSWYDAQAENEVWMDKLFAALRARYNVDLDRTTMWGLSGGAVFTSRYMLARQHVLAAAELNMGGSGRRYVAPQTAGCEIPTRFVTSMTDFLREGALSFFELLTENGHETVWVDAACEDHCFDRVAAGPEARDWLLSHTLCGATPSAGCASGPAGGAGGAGGTSNGGAGPGGAAGGGASSAGAGAGGVSGAANAGGSAGNTTAGSSGTPASGGQTTGSAGSSAGPLAGTAGASGSPATPGTAGSGAEPPALDEEGEGCACRAAGPTAARRSPGVFALLLLTGSVVGLRRTLRRQRAAI